MVNDQTTQVVLKNARTRKVYIFCFAKGFLKKSQIELVLLASQVHCRPGEFARKAEF